MVSKKNSVLETDHTCPNGIPRSPVTMTKTWLPLEANPDLLTEYCRNLGLPDFIQFHDVLGAEDWALEMIPHPVKAIVLLYPLGNEEDTHTSVGFGSTGGVFFMKQIVENACGTIAVLHEMANLHVQGKLSFSEDSYVKRMLDAVCDTSPQQRGEWLEADPEIEKAHASFQTEGQSAMLSGDVDTHFIAFVPSMDGSRVIELDGRKPGPIDHGPIDLSNEIDPFGSAVLHVVTNQFINKNPEDIRFSILALS